MNGYQARWIDKKLTRPLQFPIHRISLLYTMLYMCVHIFVNVLLVFLVQQIITKSPDQSNSLTKPHSPYASLFSESDVRPVVNSLDPKPSSLVFIFFK